MYDIPRVSFLIIANAFLLAMLVMVLAGCTSTPNRYRHGDFIMNIGSAAPVVAPAPDAPSNVAVATTPPRA